MHERSTDPDASERFANKMYVEARALTTERDALSKLLRGMTRRAIWRQRRVDEKIEMSQMWRQRAIDVDAVSRERLARVEELEAAAAKLIALRYDGGVGKVLALDALEEVLAKGAKS